MKKSIVFVIFSSFMYLFFSTQFVFSAEETIQTGLQPNPPFAVSKMHIKEVRELVSRVGWSESILVAQLAESVTLEGNIWNLLVKAAILGGRERTETVINELNHHLNQNTAVVSDHHEPAMLLFQTYDYIMALPEITLFETDLINDLKKNLIKYSEPVLDASTDTLSEAEVIHLQTAQLYAGMLTSATEQVNQLLSGNETIPSLKQNLLKAMTNEGFLYELTLQEHITICTDLLRMSKALQSYSPNDFHRLSPIIQKPADIVCELSFPSGTIPFSSKPQFNNSNQELTGLLERANVLFKNNKYKTLLDLIYKTDVRRGEALLYGELTLETDTPAIFISKALPQSGAALLRSSKDDFPVSIILDTGLSDYTSKTSLLSMQMMTGSGLLNEFSKKETIPVFNSVLVNRQRQALLESNADTPANAMIASLMPFGKIGSFASLIASGQFLERLAYPDEFFSGQSSPVNMYQRLVYLASPFVIDLFRVQGGNLHDYWYQGKGKLQAKFENEFESFQPGIEDYEFLRQPNLQPQIITLDGIYNLSFIPEFPGKDKERFWVIDPAGSELISGKNAESPFIILRRKLSDNAGNLFAVIHELIREDEIPATKIVRLPLSPAPNERDYQAVALAVERGEDTDIFVSAIRPDYTYTTTYRKGTLVFAGSFGHIKMKAGKFESLRLVGGTKLRYDTHGVELAENINIGVVNEVHSASKEIRVHFPYMLPTGNILRGNTMMVTSTEEHPVMFQPLVIENVESQDPPQTVNLMYAGNLENPQPQLAAPVRRGDQILHNNFTELERVFKDHFNLSYSAPASVMIEGATNRNRVLFRGASLIRQIRGESKAGVIMFNTEPSEAINGQVEFVRMP